MTNHQPEDTIVLRRIVLNIVLLIIVAFALIGAVSMIT